MPQTGALGAGGKAALLALQMWVEDVNAKGGLLGRKVEFIAYDDQTNPGLVPGIYTKLLDIDKVDLLIAPYGTNVTAPIMPLVKQRDLILMGNFSFDVNARIRHDKWFNNAPWGSGALAWGGAFLDAAQKLGGKSIAFMAADAEFAQNLCTGGRAIAKAKGLQTVYDQNYPPNSVDFSSIIRAVRAAKPDIVFICSYPAESVAIVRAVNEIGVGPTVKIIGGGMVGLQFTPNMEALGPLLNGFVNYNSYVPEKTMNNPAVREFLKRYEVRAKAAKVDVLGYYLPPYNYAIGQMIEQAVNATKSFDQKVLAAYMHSSEMKTMVGNIRFDTVGEWATPKLVMAQFRGIKGKDVEQFRQEGKQVIIAPAAMKTGEVVPFDKARN
jgi:branched-chain amino acid transport system substrate-binding protein